MSQPFLDTYSKLLVDTCHKRGALAMGGMSAFLPAKTPEEDEINRAKVRDDKTREANNGHDGAWVAHPALAEGVTQIFSDAFPPGGINQISVRHPDLPSDLTQDLLQVPEGERTEDGLLENIRVAILYFEAWLSGKGAVAIDGLMEDAATAEISRTLIWQWYKNKVTLDNGKVLSREYLEQLFEQAVAQVQTEVGAARWDDGRFSEAADLLKKMTLAETLLDFFTLQAYLILE